MFLFRLLWLIPVIIFLFIVLKNKTLRTEAGYLLLSIAIFAFVGFVLTGIFVVFMLSALAFFDCINTKYVVETIKEFVIVGALGGGFSGSIMYLIMVKDDMLEYKPK